MPYVIRKIKNKDLYSVKSRNGKKVHSYGTTLEKAESQVRILEQIEKEKKSQGNGRKLKQTKKSTKNDDDSDKSSYSSTSSESEDDEW